MNETLHLLHTRKSDRSFTEEPVSDAHLDAVILAGHRAPTSCNGQHVSVVVVKDAAKRARLAELCGKQPWVAKAPVFLAVVADLYKLGKGVERGGSKIKVQDCIEGALVTSLDTGITLAHMALAANALGLGTVPIGGIRNNPGDVIELLGLPPLSYVSVGLCVGHINKPTLARPRMDIASFRHDETYKTEVLDKAITVYDEELLAFWRNQDRVDGQNWSHSIAPRFDKVERPLLKPVFAKQGMSFDE
ncbi:nitroreductase family protein [Desulfovibrio sp. OttesenSCG-928-O18]|nr:nitroreductase family protein [Desulfovibrio sp. OttesenSCG-928-O18]